jgi:hypothetical protein
MLLVQSKSVDKLTVTRLRSRAEVEHPDALDACQFSVVNL